MNLDRPLAPAAHRPPQLRLLLADDSPDNQRLLKRLLQGAGFIVEAVDDGMAAVERVVAAAGNGQAVEFDVLLLDMQMPELDGYGAAAELRARGYAGPIVALTAHASEADRERCLAAGCNDYMSKPFDFDELLQMLHRNAAAGRNAQRRDVEPAA